MKLFGRELTLDEIIGFVECNANPDDDLIHRAALELIAALRDAQRKGVSTIPCCICGGEVVEFTVLNDIWNFVMRPDGHETDKEYLCLDCWYKALRSKLHESQRRERAAVEDIQFIMRHSGERGVCRKCAYSCAINGHVKPKCNDAKWRGPVAGEGEANDGQ